MVVLLRCLHSSLDGTKRWHDQGRITPLRMESMLLPLSFLITSWHRSINPLVVPKLASWKGDSLRKLMGLLLVTSPSLLLAS